MLLSRNSDNFAYIYNLVFNIAEKTQKNSNMKKILIIALAVCTMTAVSCKNGKTAEEQAPEQTVAAVAENTTNDMGVTILSDKTNADGVRELSVQPSSVCSSQIDIAVKDGVILKAEFTGGCPGNTVGVSKLVAGLTVKEAIEKLEGIDCGGKGTSCPDQLAKALKCLK